MRANVSVVVHMRVLMLGCKDWPYGSSLGNEEFVGGGTGRYVTNLSAGLAGKGVSIDIITRLFPGQKKTEDDGKITIHRVRFVKGFYTRLPSFAAFSLIRGFGIAKRADAIHGHGLFGCLTAVILSKISGKPCVVTPHGLSSIESRKVGKSIVKMLGRLERLVYTRADAVAFLSAHERNIFLERIPLPEDRYRIIESGTELPDNPHRARDATGSEPFDILYMGRLVSGKGLENLVKSYSLLADDIRVMVRYVIVGDGYLRKSLEKAASEMGVSDRIVFTGFQNSPGRYYASSDVYILPSEHEGFPVSLLEAMSYGLPCIINDFGVPISRDVLLIMPDNSPKTIAEYIERIARNRDMREMLGIKSRQLVMNRFSFERVTEEHMEMYEELAEAGA